ncbi:MAG: OadG family protein [Treponema sp.]|nr:OadG family protein [Treponema sp.]
MTIVDMLGQSGLLTLLGMGVVFSFLIIMIWFMSFSSKMIKALKLDDNETETQAVSASVAVTSDNNAVVAAIATAVKEKQNS